MTPTPPIDVKSLAGKRVTVVGLGRFGGGIGATRWACAQGAEVTVSDAASPDSLADSVAALAGLDVRLHLGGHLAADLLEADLLIINPAVPKTQPTLAEAIARGVPWTTEINLFLQLCPAPVVGVTGSVGKSTTTAMIGEILAAGRTTHVGGNIGRSLLERIDRIAPGDAVVLEMSSFMLEDTPQVAISPAVAVVTNLRPNHLDRHGTMDAYAEAKKNIYRFQGPGGAVVLNADPSAGLGGFAAGAPGRVVQVNPRSAEPFELAVPGEHNQHNAQLAFAAAAEMGATRDQAQRALRTFAGLPHRLQWVGERGGVRYFNDSKCTTPEGAAVALEAFALRTTVLIAGGYDKKVSFAPLAAAAAARAKAVVTLGATAGQIAEAIDAASRPRPAGDRPEVHSADSLEKAVQTAAQLAEPGDAVLLSPACASYDMFINYEQRGEEFTRLVKALPR